MKFPEDIRRLTIMVRVSDVARADVALTPERTYYRFATDDSIEDGELSPVKDDFATVVHAICDAAVGKEGETPLAEDMRAQLFVNNVLTDPGFTEQSLRRMVELMQPLGQEFVFLKGFIG